MTTLPGGRNTIERIARLGYGARGAVYVVVGALALLAALGHGGRAGDSEDALRAVLAGPFGAILVGGIALGLLGFALWRSVEGVTDADRRGTSPKGLAVRGAHLISAVLYFGLAASAASLGLGLGFGGGDGMHDGTAWLLGKPLGRGLVALAGLAVVGGGLGFLGKAWRGDVTDRLSLDARSRRRWAGPIGRFGYAARGIAFLIIGGFLVAAAWHQRSSEAKGLTETFALLRAQPYGWILLGLVASGHAALRRLRPDPGPLPPHRRPRHRPGGRRGGRGHPGAHLIPKAETFDTLRDRPSASGKASRRTRGFGLQSGRLAPSQQYPPRNPVPWATKLKAITMARILIVRKNRRPSRRPTSTTACSGFPSPRSIPSRPGASGRTSRPAIPAR